MAVKYNMKFRLHTLVDITESGQRKGPNKLAVGQQMNYDTLIQVIGLRANPTPIQLVEHNNSVTQLSFGSSFKGVHNYWSFDFEMPDWEITVDDLVQDFHLVPFVANLTETAKIKVAVFNTTDAKDRNVFFEQID